HGYPGVLRVDLHPPIPTDGLTEKDISALREKTFELIYSELVNDPKQSALEAIEVWKKATQTS
ncbi:hypothetical protein N9R95_02605, partial [Flavobacteriaceae bacterium]|nr:hypothetical protein [Flavobacteriaceae bacterium]